MKEVKRYSGVIVKCGDEVLLCKRNATGSLPGQWSIPGGHLEKDEHPMDGVKREFEEPSYRCYYVDVEPGKKVIL